MLFAINASGREREASNKPGRDRRDQPQRQNTLK